SAGGMIPIAPNNTSASSLSQSFSHDVPGREGVFEFVFVNLKQTHTASPSLCSVRTNILILKHVIAYRVTASATCVACATISKANTTSTVGYVIVILKRHALAAAQTCCIPPATISPKLTTIRRTPCAVVGRD